MLLIPRTVRILLAAEPIDMRNSIDGLCAIIRNQWKENLFAGALFVFISKRGDRLICHAKDPISAGASLEAEAPAAGGTKTVSCGSSARRRP